MSLNGSFPQHLSPSACFLCNLLAVTLIAQQVTGATGIDSFYFLPGAWNTKSIQQICLVLFWFLGMKHNHCFPDLCLKVGLNMFFTGNLKKAKMQMGEKVILMLLFKEKQY